MKLTGKKTKDGSFTYKQNNAKHTHTLDVRDAEVKLRVEKAKQNAKVMGNSSRDLFAASLSGASEEIIAQMPKQNAFGKLIRDQRKGPPAPKTLEKLVLSTVLTTTNEEFLLYDSREDIHKNDLSNRIIIFATTAALAFLATCDTWFMDGTFSSAPVLFEQLYSIHGSYSCIEI